MTHWSETHARVRTPVPRLQVGCIQRGQQVAARWEEGPEDCTGCWLCKPAGRPLNAHSKRASCCVLTASCYTVSPGLFCARSFRTLCALEAPVVENKIVETRAV